MKLEQPGWGDGFTASMQKVHLTKWDKFCRFFGVTTSRVRYNKMVEECQRLAETKRDRLEATRVKVDGVKRREFLSNQENKAAYDRNQKLLDDITKNRENWNEVIFGDAKPEAFQFPNGKSVPAFTVAVSRMMQKDPAKLQTLMSMKPKEAAMNKEMRKFVREVADECYDLRGKGEKEVLDFVTPKEETAPEAFRTVQDGLNNPSMSQISDSYPFTAAKRELERVTGSKYPVYSTLQPEEKLIHLAVQEAFVVNSMCEQMKECNYGMVKNAVESISKEKVGDSNTMLIEKAGGLLQTDPLTLAKKEIQRAQDLQQKEQNLAQREEPKKPDREAFAEQNRIQKESLEKLFFGDKTPEPIRLENGMTVNPLSYCLHVMEVNYPEMTQQILDLTPEEREKNPNLTVSIEGKVEKIPLKRCMASAGNTYQTFKKNLRIIEQRIRREEFGSAVKDRMISERDGAVKRALLKDSDKLTNTLRTVPDHVQNPSVEQLAAYEPLLRAKRELAHLTAVMGGKEHPVYGNMTQGERVVMEKQAQLLGTDEIAWENGQSIRIMRQDEREYDMENLAQRMDARMDEQAEAEVEREPDLDLEEPEMGR